MNLFGLVKNRACRRLRILLCGHPVLRRRSEPVPAITADIRLLACRMIATMVESDVVGVGLAAPQVGTNLRLIVLGTHDPEQPVRADASPGELLLGPRMPVVMVNPEVLWSAPETESVIEGCLSIPDVSGPVERPRRVIVRALDLDGSRIQVECGGLLGRCIQHEIDHLDGILFVDRLTPEDRAPMEARIRQLERRTASRRPAAGQSS